MATIGLVIRSAEPDILKLASEVISWSEKHSHECVIEESCRAHIKSKLKVLGAPELVSKADPIVTLGGDGTLIGVARYVEHEGPVMLGVNFGTLGFLTEITPNETITVLESIFKKTASFETRSMLLGDVIRGGKSIFRSQAVNDVVVQKGTRDRMLDLDIAINGEEVVRVRGDGLIVATPTGSTAYSLAAGGSIAHPSLEVALVTPICPHSLTIRPFVLAGSDSITITIPEYEGAVFVSMDSQASCELKTGDKVVVTKAKNRVKFVRSPTKSYFDILRTKLNWGIANKAE